MNIKTIALQAAADLNKFLAFLGLRNSDDRFAPATEHNAEPTIGSAAPEVTRPVGAPYVEPKIWSPHAAANREELANVLYTVAAGLTKQVANAATLRDPARAEMKLRLSQIANELHEMPLKQVFPGESKMTAWPRIDAASQPKAPEAAKNGTMLANALFGFASGLKSQVIASPVLGSHDLRGLKTRISELADELHGMQQDALIRPNKTKSHKIR